MSVGHIVLLGDSVFDNQSYVPPGRATRDALQARLPDGWRVTLLAQDGSTIDEVTRQLLEVPPDATQLVVSTGGNDALSEGGLLSERVGSVGEALWKLAQIAERFERRYRAMVRRLRARRLPTTVCTIYQGNFDPSLQSITGVALAVFNDAIIRAAWAARLPILDLRVVCSDPEDYTNQIEPSARGSARLADAIADVVLQPGSRDPPQPFR